MSGVFTALYEIFAGLGAARYFGASPTPHHGAVLLAARFCLALAWPCSDASIRPELALAAPRACRAGSREICLPSMCGQSALPFGFFPSSEIGVDFKQHDSDLPCGWAKTCTYESRNPAGVEDAAFLSGWPRAAASQIIP